MIYAAFDEAQTPARTKSAGVWSKISSGLGAIAHHCSRLRRARTRLLITIGVQVRLLSY